MLRDQPEILQRGEVTEDRALVDHRQVGESREAGVALPRLSVVVIREREERHAEVRGEALLPGPVDGVEAQNNSSWASSSRVVFPEPMACTACAEVGTAPPTSVVRTSIFPVDVAL